MGVLLAYLVGGWVWVGVGVCVWGGGGRVFRISNRALVVKNPQSYQREKALVYSLESE